MIIETRRFTVLLSGILALIISMGIARYAFTPMLPIMQQQVGVTESLGGWLAGWHYIGYIIGLFIVWLITDLRTKDFFYRYGLVVSVISTLCMGIMEHSLMWYVSRFFAGVTCATSFMLGSGLILSWLNHHGHQTELGLHFSGIGIGIVCGALLVDYSGIGTWFNFDWQRQWLTLATVAGLLLIPAILLLPMPKDPRLGTSKPSDLRRNVPQQRPSTRWLLMMQGAYFCAGFSNTMNVTFTSLITELQPLQGLGAKMWLLVGIAAAPAPLIWDRIARKIGRIHSLSLAYLLGIAGNLCLAFTLSLEMTALAAILFGFTFMGVVSLTLSTVGHFYGVNATQAMARLTFFYCIAQILSPILSGVIAETTGSFQIPLFAISAIMLLGLALLLFSRRYLPAGDTSTPALR